MQPGQKEKLQGLIRTSKLLAPPEKTEWLGILELMNDKQLLELEKILSSALPKPAPKTVLPPVPQPKAAPAPALPKPPAQSEGPRLGHIMNFPRPSAAFSPAPAKPMPRPAPVLKPAAAAKKESSWSGILKKYLTEKELPTSKPEFELELPDGQKHPPIPAIRPPVPAAKPEQQPKPVFKLQKPVPSFHPAPVFIPPVKAFAPAPKTENSAAQGEHVPSGQTFSRSLELADVAAFDMEFWRKYTSYSVTAQLTALVQRAGYHAVLQQLEQSPLYKAYLITGIKMLKDQITFEGSALKQDAACLNRYEFNSFADMLLELQTV